MYAATVIIVIALAAPDEPTAVDFLRHSQRQPIADVAADLDTLSHLSPAAFDLACPSIINLLRTTRSTALKTRTLDLLCAKANANRVGEMIAYLDECLDGLQQDKRRTHYGFIEGFVSSDLSTWGDAMRSSPATIAFLNRVARYRPPDPKKSSLDPSVLDMATDTLFQLMPDVQSKRQAMLALIRDRAAGSDKAAVLLPPIADTATIAALRTMLDQGDMNLNAARALAELGDAGALPILNRRKTELESQVGQPYHDQLEYVRRAIHAIEVLQNNATLLAFIRSSASDGHLFPFNKFWAVQKAQSRGVSAADLRSAVLEWATKARPHERGDIKAFGIATGGILNVADLPDAGPSLSRQFGHARHVVRRTGQVPVPARKEKQGTGTTWEPNEANYAPLEEWMQSVQWESLSGSEAAGMLKAKLCELDLLHPANCMN